MYICYYIWSVRLMDTGLWNSAGDAGRVRIQARKAYMVYCIYEHRSSHDWDRIKSTISIAKVTTSAKCKSPIDCVACKNAHAQFITSFPVHLRDAQSIVLHRRFIVMCPWAYETIYGWRSMEMDLCQLLLPAGFAGTYCTYYGYYHWDLWARLRVHLRLREGFRTCLRAFLKRALQGD